MKNTKLGLLGVAVLAVVILALVLLWPRPRIEPQIVGIKADVGIQPAYAEPKIGEVVAQFKADTAVMAYGFSGGFVCVSNHATNAEFFGWIPERAIVPTEGEDLLPLPALAAKRCNKEGVSGFSWFLTPVAGETPVMTPTP